MSLKAFHFVFIVASILVSGLFGAWCLQNQSWSENPGVMAFGMVSLLASLALIPYLYWFLKKTQNWSLLALSFIAISSLLVPEVSEACAVCLGKTNSPLVAAVNGGVWLLLFVVGGVLGGLATLFFYWASKARALNQ